ncbi:MAG: nucleoside deaminase [Limnochordia bacterium]|nr:nucleoside deaminase [Bacillota bacterium]NLH31989.1 nucleoside deaminase [Bacillota bacterium]HOB09531.1 nucleoside deaminase [Limnochordia bacterium]HPZ30825.1 nucleoside deaminase [Limnochordia bacterium]HQD71105.1 nucleoside deaminase [Limnochordia bacterium]
MSSLGLGIWDQCIDLALEAYNAGSMGIAAVIVDAKGDVVAVGRNQLRDGLVSCNSIKMTSIAHAEINAINNIPWEKQKDWELMLYTTVEPCPMCMGAIAMSRIRRVVVGSADPYAGSVRLLEKDDYLKQKGISVEFAQGKVEEICFVLHYLSLRRRLKPEHPIFRSLQERYPAYVKKMDDLLSSSFLSGREIGRAQLMEVAG